MDNNETLSDDSASYLLAEGLSSSDFDLVKEHGDLSDSCRWYELTEQSAVEWGCYLEPGIDTDESGRQLRTSIRSALRVIAEIAGQDIEIHCPDYTDDDGREYHSHVVDVIEAK